MIKVIFVLALLLASSPGKSQQVTGNVLSDKKPSNNMPDTKKKNIKDILGKERASSIAKARQLNVYLLDKFVTNIELQKKDEKKYFADYEVLGFNKVDKKKSKALKRIILDANNYMGLDYINKCTFTATVGLELISKKEKVNAVISYPCNKILFIKNGQEFYRDLKSIVSLDRIMQELLKIQSQPTPQ